MGALIPAGTKAARPMATPDSGRRHKRVLQLWSNAPGLPEPFAWGGFAGANDGAVSRAGFGVEMAIDQARIIRGASFTRIPARTQGTAATWHDVLHCFFSCELSLEPDFSPYSLKKLEASVSGLSADAV